ncbi:hypothetical protein E4U42_005661 [Claviceps africana]|uniref:Uncharacterized protein n=1 Tax=Claviceps africana TaxID=83212 RepID=A0A8K0JDV5_9HYPO|nr:hypothetical protein E4U42_005661 [Claviceps africana]
MIPASTARGVLGSNVNSLIELNVSKNLVGTAGHGESHRRLQFSGDEYRCYYLPRYRAGPGAPPSIQDSQLTQPSSIRGSPQISVPMPSLEVRTLGGGKILEPQSAMLLLGVRGSHATEPGELSLCAALEAGHLVQAHMAPSNAGSRFETPAPR